MVWGLLMSELAQGLTNHKTDGITFSKTIIRSLLNILISFLISRTLAERGQLY